MVLLCWVDQLLIRSKYLIKKHVIFSDRLVFEPITKIRNAFYRCDSKFYIDDIVNMYTDYVINGEYRNINGVIYSDGKICNYYELENKNLKKISSNTIRLQNQFKKGGQSTNRLSRNRDIQRDHNITSLVEKTIDIFYDKKENKSKVSNLIFCGPAEFKVELSEHKLINSFFSKIPIHIIKMEDFDYTLLMKTVANFDNSKEISHISNIKELIALADDKLAFGDEIKEYLKTCQLKIIYVHTENKLLDTVLINYNVQIIRLSSTFINDYGGIIGVKFY